VLQLLLLLLGRGGGAASAMADESKRERERARERWDERERESRFPCTRLPSNGKWLREFFGNYSDLRKLHCTSSETIWFFGK
jgi:hypothetical protein